MNDIIKKFKEWLILNGHTSFAYISPVKNFLKKVPLEEITQEKVDKYFLWVIKTYKERYINSVISSLKAFFTFLEKDIKLPKRLKEPRPIPISISLKYFEEEVIPTVDCAYFDNPIKVKAILYLMFYTGMRKSEVYLLKRENIDLKKGRIKVYLKKTKKEKIMLIPKKVIKKLELYFIIEPEYKNAFNLGVDGIDYIFNKLNPYFKEINFHPHLLKASAITHLNKCGFSDTEICEIVGISKSTLAHYLDVSIYKIEKDYNKRIK